MNVFLSSTWDDLNLHREEVIGALRAAGWHVLNAYLADPRPTPPTLRQDILKSDLFVGLLGHFYGTTVDDGRSFTEFEYDTAHKAKIPCVMFLADGKIRYAAELKQSQEQSKKQEDFRSKIGPSHKVGLFSDNPKDLAISVVASAASWSVQGSAFRLLFAEIHFPPDHFTDRKEPREQLSAWLSEDSKPIAEVIGPKDVGTSSLCSVWVRRDVLGLATPSADPVDVLPTVPVEGVVWWGFAEPNFDQFAKTALNLISPTNSLTGRKHGPDDVLKALIEELHRRRLVVVLDCIERLFAGYNVINNAYEDDDKFGREPREFSVARAARFVEEVYSRRHMGFRSRIVITGCAGIKTLDNQPGCIRINLKDLEAPYAYALLKRGGGESLDATVGGSLLKRITDQFGSSPALIRAISDITRVAGVSLQSLAEKAKNYSRTESKHIKFGDFLAGAWVLDTHTTDLIMMLSGIRGPFTLKEFHFVLRKITREASEMEAAGRLAQLVEMGLAKRVDSQSIGFPAQLFVLIDPVRMTRAPEEISSLMGEILDNVKELETTPRAFYKAVAAMRDDVAGRLLDEMLCKRPNYDFGGIHVEIEMIQTLLPRCAEAGKGRDERTSHALLLQQSALLRSRLGEPELAVSQLVESVSIYRGLEDVEGAAEGLGMLAIEHLKVGQLADAEIDLRDLVAIYGEGTDQSKRTRAILALVMIRGAAGEDADSLPLDTVVKTCFRERELGANNFQSIFHALRALRQDQPNRAVDYAKHALQSVPAADLVEKTRVQWVLGESLVRWANDKPADSVERRSLTKEADLHLESALNACEPELWPDYWADILLSLARLRQAQGRLSDALSLAHRSQGVSERHGYRLKLADIHNFLGQVKFASGQRREALAHARRARDHADCGPPPYTYQPALRIAKQLIAKLGG